jgi:hypothetical protein
MPILTLLGGASAGAAATYAPASHRRVATQLTQYVSGVDRTRAQRMNQTRAAGAVRRHIPPVLGRPL